MHWCKHPVSDTLNDIPASESFFAALLPRGLKSPEFGGMRVISKRSGKSGSSEVVPNESIAKRVSELLWPVEWKGAIIDLPLLGRDGLVGGYLFFGS